MATRMAAKVAMKALQSAAREMGSLDSQQGVPQGRRRQKAKSTKNNKGPSLQPRNPQPKRMPRVQQAAHTGQPAASKHSGQAIQPKTLQIPRSMGSFKLSGAAISRTERAVTVYNFSWGSDPVANLASGMPLNILFLPAVSSSNISLGSTAVPHQWFYGNQTMQAGYLNTNFNTIDRNSVLSKTINGIASANGAGLVTVPSWPNPASYFGISHGFSAAGDGGARVRITSATLELTFESCMTGEIVATSFTSSDATSTAAGTFTSHLSKVQGVYRRKIPINGTLELRSHPLPFTEPSTHPLPTAYGTLSNAVEQKLISDGVSGFACSLIGVRFAANQVPPGVIVRSFVEYEVELPDSLAHFADDRPRYSPDVVVKAYNNDFSSGVPGVGPSRVTGPPAVAHSRR